jgi:thioesterase domain-containing protein/acyl carrier protein
MQLLQQVLAAVLQCAVETIAVQANVFALGLSSLGAVRFLTALEQLLGQKLSSSALFEYPSLTQFAAYLQQQFSFVVTQADVAALTNTLTHVLTPPAHPDFPELVALNAVTTGRPVFWFHGGLGGVQPYHVLAQVCTRPFYGFLASGWNSERPPLYGVETMAAYYIQAMQAVQPTGPYEVGGYSLGGLLAYEVTRQLQQHGETVASIVMLDTFEVSGLTAPKQSQKSAYLQAVNIALQTRVMQDPAAFARILIHRDQVDTQLDEAAFLQQLIALAQTRGVFYSADHLATQVVKQAEVQTAHQAHRYSMPPLPQPEAVQCYYVRNRNGVYMGELAPYFMLPGDEFDFEQKAHWQAWQALLPNFTLLEVDAANHLVLLSEPKVCQQLMDFCHNLYSGRLDLTGSEKF